MVQFFMEHPLMALVMFGVISIIFLGVFGLVMDTIKQMALIRANAEIEIAKIESTADFMKKG